MSPVSRLWVCESCSCVPAEGAEAQILSLSSAGRQGTPRPGLHFKFMFLGSFSESGSSKGSGSVPGCGDHPVTGAGGGVGGIKSWTHTVTVLCHLGQSCPEEHTSMFFSFVGWFFVFFCFDFFPFEMGFQRLASNFLCGQRRP